MKIMMKSMLQALFAGAVMMGLTACNGQQFTVTGEILGATDSVLHFENMGLAGPVELGSLQLEQDGKFSYGGHADNDNEGLGYTVGYTFDIGRKGGNPILEAVRVYVNANNVYTFRNALTPYGIDPETTDGSTYVYPLTRIFMAGLSFRF